MVATLVIRSLPAGQLWPYLRISLMMARGKRKGIKKRDLSAGTHARHG